jgi:hypothetical protein
LVFFDALTTKSDVPTRTTAGKRLIAMPLTGLPETDIRLPGCRGCPKELTHNVCSHIGILPPVSEARYDRIEEDEKLSDLDGNLLTQTLWLLHSILYGIIDFTLLNVGAGTANNAAHQVDYEILGVDGLAAIQREPGLALRRRGASDIRRRGVFPADGRPDPVSAAVGPVGQARSLGDEGRTAVDQRRRGRFLAGTEFPGGERHHAV